jgi:hypothetical protein
MAAVALSGPRVLIFEWCNGHGRWPQVLHIQSRARRVLSKGRCLRGIPFRNRKYFRTNNPSRVINDVLQRVHAVSGSMSSAPLEFSRLGTVHCSSGNGKMVVGLGQP